QHRGQRVVVAAEGGRQAVVAEPAVALLADQPGVLEHAEVARYARLRQAEHAGELGDVEALARQHSQQAQARLVAKQPIQRRRLFHIYESTFIDTTLASGERAPVLTTRRSTSASRPSAAVTASGRRAACRRSGTSRSSCTRSPRRRCAAPARRRSDTAYGSGHGRPSRRGMP